MNPDPEIFFKVLDAEDSTTGGGSASALAGAMAGGLLAMVCRLSIKEPDEAGAVFAERAVQAKELSDQLLQGSQADGKAFESVRGAFRLPKESQPEREARQQAIQSAWFEAAWVPLENAKRCVQVLRLGLEAAGGINPNVRSDLNCALLLARAGALGCLENVTINLPNLKNASLALTLSMQVDRVRAELDSLGEKQPAWAADSPAQNSKSKPSDTG